MELGTSHMSGREVGTSRRFWSGREVGTSRRFWFGMELDISQKFEWEPELSISRWFEADKEQVPELHRAGGRATPPPWCEFVKLGNKQVTPLS